MSDFNPDSFLDETKDFDPDAFLSETPEEQYEQREGQFQADRMKGSMAQRALNALERFKAHGDMRALAPDERDALMQMMGGNSGPRQPGMGTLEAMNLRGVNAAMLGWGDELGGGVRAGVKKLQGDKRPMRQVYEEERDTIRGGLNQAQREHPTASAFADIAGGLPAAAALPGGLAGSMATGGIAGAGAAPTAEAEDLALSTGAGVAGGALGYLGGKYLPGAVKKGIEYTKLGAGKAMQLPQRGIDALKAFIGGEADDVAEAAAKEVVPEQVRKAEEQLLARAGARKPSDAAREGLPHLAASMDDQLAEAAAANAGPPPDRFQGIMDQVNAQGRGNIRPGDWKPIPAEKYDDVALQRLIDQQAAERAARATAEKEAEFAALGGTKNVRAPAAAPQPVRDTEAMSLYDAMHMDEIPGMPHDSGAPWENWNTIHQAKGPAAKASATFDNAMRDMNFESLDRIAKGQPGVSAPKSAPVSTIDPRVQKIIDAQKQNPDALEAFGVDPRKNERGFDVLGPMLATAGLKGAGAGAKMASRAGQALESSARSQMSPDAMARSLVANPSVLFHLARTKGQVGAAAKSVLEAIQSGDRNGLKARAALLATMPEFRQMFARDRAATETPGSAASGF